MTRTILTTLFTLFFPMVVTFIYLFFSRWPERWFTGASDWLAISVAILIGLIGLWALPLKPWYRALATFLYVPAMGALLAYFMLLLVCDMFGDCL